MAAAINPWTYAIFPELHIGIGPAALLGGGMLPTITSL